jgi:hypothetical protein
MNMFRNATKDQNYLAWLVHQDGLIDIFAGLVILGFALDLYLETSYWFISMVLVGYFLILMSGKEVVTKPRLYHFSITSEQKILLAKTLLAGVIWFVTGAALGILVMVGYKLGVVICVHVLQNYVWLLMAWFLALGLSLLAYTEMGGKRFFTYALVIIFLSTLRQMFAAQVLPFLFVTSGLLVIPGLFLLVRFIVRYPEKEAFNHARE